jgi:solute carrier family 25, member 34/35
MAMKGSTRAYRGIFHCLYHNWQTAGIRGLQRGLSYGILREFFFNGVRIGCYEPVLHQYQHLRNIEANELSNYERFFLGQFVGAFAGAFVNPIEVLKVRSQALGGLTGYQHTVQNVFQATKSLIKEEGARFELLLKTFHS